jgi:iron(III) transport system substrate-binding protein
VTAAALKESGRGLPHSKTLARVRSFWSAAVLCRFQLILLLVWSCPACRKTESVVTVYASQDQVYAEPILTGFTKETGIRVRAVYDSEAVKTVGLVNRLIAEQANPQCDVFWNNEALRTRQLEARNVVEKWTPVGHRSRRVVINTNLISAAPKSLVELTNVAWKGKVALAYPLFGTTATHFLALRQHWGTNDWELWCRALQANKPLLVDGNSVVVQLVGRSEVAIGLTDSDDIAAGQKQGMPIQALPLDQDSLLIPNTVAMIRNPPHPKEARRLYEYLQSAAVRKALVAASALENDMMTNTTGINVDWPQMLNELDGVTTTLRRIFLR